MARARSWSKLVPERISPPEASGAPESRLPVCELWMLPFCASALYSPRMKSIRSRKSASGASTWPSSMSRPLPRAHHSLWKPLPENSTARRTGASLAPRTALASSPQTRNDSIHGSAMLTPTPRRKVRREKL